MSLATPPAAWLGIACAAHVRRGRAEGFMQLCHGKAAPLRRIRPGDVIADHSPREGMPEGSACRAVRAVGIVASGDSYRVEMAPGFVPWRRDVAWLGAEEAPIAPLLPRLSFGGPGQGHRLRFGVIPIAPAAFALLLAATRG